MGNCTSSGGGGGGSSRGASPTTSNAALNSVQSDAANRMAQANSNDDRDAYRVAATDFANSLDRGDTITEFTVRDYQYAGGGEILTREPTIWTKNSDGTISLKGSTRKMDAQEWARWRWRHTGGNTFLKGELTPQQIADEMTKIKKKNYSLRKKK